MAASGPSNGRGKTITVGLERILRALLPQRRSRGRHVLIIVQNQPVPLVRRVWMEATALVAAGYDVSVISPKGPEDPPHEVLDGVHLYKYDPPRMSRGPAGFLWEVVYCWLQTFRLLLRVSARQRVDVVQACNPPDTYFALAAPLKLLGVRFVYDQLDLCPELYQVRFPEGPSLLLRVLTTLERASYRFADHVVATNESFREIAIRRGRLDPDRVTVVRNAPLANRLRRGAAHPRLRSGRRYLCCYLGIMGPQDGVDLLLRAIAEVVHHRGQRDCQFALLGFGDCFEELQLLVDELDIAPWVTFTGRADDVMITNYLSTADLAVAPDPRNAFNNLITTCKVSEYMAFELPVVAFDLKETRVSAGDAALYAVDNDPARLAGAIARLLEDPDQRRRMGVAGRQRVESWLSWENQSAAYVGVYEKLLGPLPTDEDFLRNPESDAVTAHSSASATADREPVRN